jgi:hypothetical protein
MANITIAYSGFTGSSTRVVRANSISVGFKRDLQAEPNANFSSTVLAEVQTQGVENPRYSLQGVHLAGYGETTTLAFGVATSILTWADLYTLSKIQYNGTNQPILRVGYGPTNALQTLSGYAGTTTIPVILESFNLNLDARDSKDAYRPSLNINLLETD